MEQVDYRNPARIAFGGGTGARDATRAKPAFRSLHAFLRVQTLDPVETCPPPHQVADDVADAFTQGVAHYLTHPAGVLAQQRCADGLPQDAARVSGIADLCARASEPWPGPACRRAHRAAPYPFR
jgi:hypothetical protein